MTLVTWSTTHQYIQIDRDGGSTLRESRDDETRASPDPRPIPPRRRAGAPFRGPCGRGCVLYEYIVMYEPGVGTHVGTVPRDARAIARGTLIALGPWVSPLSSSFTSSSRDKLYSSLYPTRTLALLRVLGRTLHTPAPPHLSVAEAPVNPLSHNPLARSSCQGRNGAMHSRVPKGRPSDRPSDTRSRAYAGHRHRPGAG